MDFRRVVRQHLPPLMIEREPEIVEELAQHLGELYREGRSAGLDHDRALGRALAALPRDPHDFAKDLESASRALPGLIADRWRARHAAGAEPLSDRTRSWSMLADLRRDIRYAMRMLTRTPGLTLVISLTLALGIGANAVIFSAVDAVLLWRPPVGDPSSLASIYTISGRDRFSTSAYPDYVDLRDSGVFAGVAVFASIPLVLQTNDGAEPIRGELVSGNYFEVLGLTIPLGRGFSPAEDQAGAPVRVVVISHAAWTRRFGGDPAVIGRHINLNGHSYAIIGVAPQGFTHPIVGRAPEVWAPAPLQPDLRPPSAGARRNLGSSNLLAARSNGWLSMVARMKPGDTVSSAAAAAATVSTRLAAAYPGTNRSRTFNVVALGEGPGIRASTAPLLRLLTAAVFVVLVIACANVASLMLARAVTRRREVAIRIAVGAGRSRLVRQWLTECILLSLAGAAGGLLIAWWGAPILRQFGIPEGIPLGVSARVLLFTLAICVLSALLFGVAPVLQMIRPGAIEALRDEGGAVASGLRATRLRSGFVVMQVALSLVLLAGAVLFVRTLQNALSVDLGYDVDRVLVTDINLDLRGYSQDAGQMFYSRLLERVAALPGVEAAGAARVTVLSGAARTTRISIDGRPLEPDGGNGTDVRANVISERYLEVMGIRLRAGRNFSPSDTAGAPLVAIVSESLATTLFQNIDPVGRTFMIGRNQLQIVGVAPDTVYRSVIEADPLPFFYLPLRQNYEGGVALHVRSTSDPQSLVSAIRRALHELDPQLVLGRPRLLRDELEQSLGAQRMMATMVGLFGVVAILLAGIGLYGVMAQAVGQRTTEIGLRLALGAEPAAILKMMLSYGLKLVGAGTVIGVAAALATARYVEHQLFGIAPRDPVTLVVVVGILMVVAIAACLIPTRRAMRVDPALALRGN